MHFQPGIPVLEDISLDLAPGKLLSVVGPSGSGKTTLLKLLAGLLTPVSGAITFDGQPLEGPDIRLVPGYEEIRLVEQHSGLRPNITAEENLRIALLGFKEAYKEERLHYLTELFFLENYRDFYPRQLSGGQQQRLTIACAMANEPDVLLLDEPFSALDPANTSLLIKNIQKLAHQTKTAIVLVTHDTRYALMADEVMVILKGKCVQKTTPHLVYHKPASKEIAAFFGPLTQLSGTLKKELNLNPTAMALARAETIKVKKKGKGFPGVITGHSFMGVYNLLEVKLATGDKILALDFGRKWVKGDSIVAELVPDRLIIL